MSLTVVYGPPLAGKTTWVRTQAAPGDLVLDYDDVQQAIAPGSAPLDKALRPYVLAAMNSVLKEWRRRPDRPANLWLIRTYPSEADTIGADVVRVDPGLQACLERAKDSPHAVAGIERWYDSPTGVGGHRRPT